jgi:hypothetical protein
MNLLRNVIGPQSKYDKSIPYAYMTEVSIIEDNEDLCSYYYGDTICSLIEHLSQNNISPKEVKLYGLFRDEETIIDITKCTNKTGAWLLRPELCRSLEEHYQETLHKIYKGHVEIGQCSFDDRDEIII